MLQIEKSSLLHSSLRGLWISLDQSEASIRVMWSVSTNQRPVLLYKKLLYCDKSDLLLNNLLNASENVFQKKNTLLIEISY